MLDKTKEEPIEETKLLQKRITELETIASENKLLEEALNISEIRYRRLFESAQGGILILHAGTGIILDINPYLINMLEYTKEEFIGKELWELNPFKDIVKSNITFNELQEKEYIRYDNIPLETKNGRKMECEFISNVYLEGDQKIIQCNIRDNSSGNLDEVLRFESQSQQQAVLDQKLKESEGKYKILYELFADGIMVADTETTKILYANPSLCSMLGYTEEELKKMKALDVHPVDMREYVMSRFMLMAKKEIVLSGDVPLYVFRPFWSNLHKRSRGFGCVPCLISTNIYS